jgi:RNA polymerase sigma factor (sigma-70 family)
MTAPAHDITVRDAVSEIEDLYSEHFELLLGIAIRTFGIPREDATTLVHDVFVSLISRLDEIRHRRAWLVGAISNASRSYLRRRESNHYRNEHAARARDVCETSLDLVAVRQALERIDERSREILRLRYLQGYTVAELAGHLHTTSGYTEKLLRKALLRAWEVFGGTDERTLRRTERRDSPRV